MNARLASKTTLRMATLRATGYLLIARMRVRFGSLAKLREKPSPRFGGASAEPLDRARFWARRIERASQRLPGESKCLPRALALYWLLGTEGIATQLNVAIHAHDREGDHALHAWLERNGVMLIGDCDREQYRVVFHLGDKPA